MPKAKPLERKAPESPLKDMLKQMKEIPRPKMVDKRWIGMKTAASEGETTVTAENLRPSTSQLSKINQFTRKKVTADDVVVLPTLACNDLVDRDVDQFPTSTIKEFHKLNGQLGPVGKSFMVSHDHRTLPVGRIFDKGIETTDDGATHLKLYSYIPNTEANKSFIENLEFGVYWAVSVGVMLDHDACKVGGEDHAWGMGWFGPSWYCVKGHEKGQYYDLSSDEEDDWGYPVPLDPSKYDANNPDHFYCVRQMEGAKDFYELSQVYLGAQYFAELTDNKGALAGVTKGAKSFYVGLSAEEGKHLDMPVSERLRTALKRHKAEAEEDGSISWIDEQGMKWISDSGKTVCLGVAKDAEDEELDEVEDETKVVPPVEENKADEEDSEEDEENEDSDEEESDEETEEDTEEEMSKAVVLAAATKAGVSPDLLAEIGKAEGNGLAELVGKMAEENKSLRQKSADEQKFVKMGKDYVADLRKEVIANYVRAYQEESRPVDTEIVERLLDACGEDTSLIKELGGTYLKEAQRRFGEPVRRSTFETNPNENLKPESKPKEEPEVPTKARNKKSGVARLHG